MSFGVLALLPWWLWLLMVFGSGFAWTAGSTLGGAFVRAVGRAFGEK